MKRTDRPDATTRSSGSSWRCRFAALSLALIAQPVLSQGDDERVVERSEAADPGPRPAIVEEVTGERTPASRTYATEDGGRTARVFPEPIHFENANGNLQTIDNELVDSPLDGFAVRNRSNRFRADLPGDASRAVRFAVGDDVVRFGLRGADGTGSRAGQTVRYPGALAGVDLEYAMRPLGLKEALVLRDRRAPSEFVFDVDLSEGLRLRGGADGVVEVARGDG